MTGPATTGDHWGWAQTVALIVPFITFFGAAVVATVTYALNQRAARRERQAKAFAEALAAIEDYAEMPYRVRRRRPHPDARYEITAEISKVKSRIAFHQAWLQIEAPDVTNAYNDLDRAAREQAGRQMSEAWQLPPLTSDEQMNLRVAYSRDQIDAARTSCIAAMLRSLGRHKHAQRLPLTWAATHSTRANSTTAETPTESEAEQTGDSM